MGAIHRRDAMQVSTIRTARVNFRIDRGTGLAPARRRKKSISATFEFRYPSCLVLAIPADSACTVPIYMRRRVVIIFPWQVTTI
jgi:hypothetical protein